MWLELGMSLPTTFESPYLPIKEEARCRRRRWRHRKLRGPPCQVLSEFPVRNLSWALRAQWRLHLSPMKALLHARQPRSSGTLRRILQIQYDYHANLCTLASFRRFVLLQNPGKRGDQRPIVVCGLVRILQKQRFQRGGDER